MLILGWVRNQRVHISAYEAWMKGQVMCAHGHPLVAKRGPKVTHHFAHKHNTGCTADKGTWHVWHQHRFPPDRVEVRMVQGQKVHYADAVDKAGRVVEFQHSPMDAKTIKERERFYRNMIWVFDVQRCTFEWLDSRRIQQVTGTRYWHKATCPFFLDMGHNGLYLITQKQPFHVTPYTWEDYDKEMGTSGPVREGRRPVKL